jgi:hypothetical protein
MLKISLTLLIWSIFSDPLLKIIYSTPDHAQEKPENEDYGPDLGHEDFRSDSSYENGEHYSWDDLYLCDFCETEVILNPYE